MKTTITEKELVEWFGTRMLKKLEAKRGLRPHWSIGTTIQGIVSHLKSEVEELDVELAFYHAGKSNMDLVIDEAADIANCAAILADLFRSGNVRL